MMPVAACLLIYNVAMLSRPARSVSAGAVWTWAGVLLTCAFYLLVIWCYARRGPASATSSAISAHVAAVVATLCPFVVPLLSAGRPSAGQAISADVLLLLGSAWSVWALKHLGRNLSVIAQARSVADNGPYRWLRHPLYLGEIVSTLGLAIAAGTLAALIAWAALCGLQIYRAVREEQVLARTLPDYRAYQAHTAALLPGIF